LGLFDLLALNFVAKGLGVGAGAIVDHGLLGFPVVEGDNLVSNGRKM